MVNILLESFDIDAEYLRPELEKYIKRGNKVVIIAFSFRDREVLNADDWDALYSRERGKYYWGMIRPFEAFGISEDDIDFINYCTDTHESAVQKITDADIVYFPGGLPDRMMDRINEFGLRKILMQHNGVVMGFSAGAVIQMEEYHLSPDDDYAEFSYFNGLPYLKDFYLEVHYEGTETQDSAINRVLAERKTTVYATVCDKGAILVADGKFTLLGDVKTFEP